MRDLKKIVDLRLRWHYIQASHPCWTEIVRFSLRHSANSCIYVSVGSAEHRLYLRWLGAYIFASTGMIERRDFPGNWIPKWKGLFHSAARVREKVALHAPLARLFNGS